MGEDAAGAVARGYGGDDVQPLDIPLPEATRRATADGAPSSDEGDYGGQEEERQDRCPDDRRSAAGEFVSGLLCDAGGAGGVEATDAVPGDGSARDGAIQEQDGG